MGTITTLRPSATSSGVGWSAVASGTLDEVTSDDSDATYALWSGAGSAMILATPLDAPPAGERRHLVRLRARGEDGSAWWAVRLASGSLVAGASATFTASPATVSGSWGSGAPHDGSTVLSCYVTGQSTGVKINELYLDVDTRLAPTFTPQTLDGTGTSNTTISDTASPTVHINAPDFDDLAPRQYRYWVTLSGAIVWDTGVVSGAPVDRMTSPLENGSYVLHTQIWSTLGANTAYASDEETLSFTINVGEVPAPNAPSVTPELPFYRVEACAPGDLSDFDGSTAYVEIQRVDCPVGGYLDLPGSSGAYASTPDPPDVVLYSFDVTATPWVGEGSTTVQRVTTPVHDGAGALEASRAFPASGFGQVRFNDNSGLRDLSANGPTLAAWVLVPAGTPGAAWVANLQVQDPGFTWIPGPVFPITPGVWTLITHTPDPGLLANCRSIGFDIGANDVNGTFPIYVDTVMQGYPPFVAAPTDLQITVFAQRSDGWRPASFDETLVAKYVQTGDERSWRLALDQDGDGDPARAGRPFLSWSTDGTSGTVLTATADERAPIDAFGRAWIRATLDVDNGAGGWTVTFESKETEDGDWVPIGAPVTGTGTTSIFAGSADIEVGGFDAGTSQMFTGRVYSVEVQDPTTGAVLVSPDFTIHPAGTDTFTDSVGAVWAVNGLAALTSAQTASTIVMLGPLEEAECAEWVDFTLPRAGVGRSCDHEPASCCSYYRARTVGLVDGSIMVSTWSDAFNPGVPEGVIVMWPSTVATIPAGWNRVNTLDGRYVKGVATAATEPGTTGGAAGHFHTTPGHTHSTNHAHTTGASTQASTNTFLSHDGVAGTQAFATGHTHSWPDTDSANVNSQSTAPNSSSGSNDPARLEVVWISSDGNPTGLPNGSLAFMNDISPAGWTTYADATNRFLKGAAPGADGGITVDSELSNHTHDVEAHIHPGTVHSHTSADTGTTSGTLSFFAGPNATTWDTEHSHPVSVGLTSAAILQNSTAGASGATSPAEPPYRNLRVRQNTSGAPDLPVGAIGAWLGALADIPTNWALCDGTGGTSDMTGLHPRAADASIGTTGGGDGAHTHTGNSHDHPTTGHAHSSTTGVSSDGTANVSATAAVGTVTATHTHPTGDTDAATPTVGSADSGTLVSATTEPPYTEVALIQLMAEPTPPAEAETFCLEWDEDYHLIRTTGPDGPIYADVAGKFEWEVTRPFTAATGVMGTRFVTSASPGGRNLKMVAAVESETELATLRAVLTRPLVLISPSDSSEVWAAPVAESVRIVKVGRIRQVMADFIATGPEPAPQLADVGA